MFLSRIFWKVCIFPVCLFYSIHSNKVDQAALNVGKDIYARYFPAVSWNKNWQKPSSGCWGSVRSWWRGSTRSVPSCAKNCEHKEVVDSVDGRKKNDVWDGITDGSYLRIVNLVSLCDAYDIALACVLYWMKLLRVYFLSAVRSKL